MSSIQDKLIPVNLEKEMKRSFISYAMAVIIDRALPDVRDGLKPVHRRILYDMEELGMTPDKPYRKSARLVGDVLGKFHPHGDSSVYDAMVRLAQPFNIRYTAGGRAGQLTARWTATARPPCVTPKPACPKLTLYLLGGIEKDTVDFYPNFDETLHAARVCCPAVSRICSSTVPAALPSAWPPTSPRITCGEVIDGAICMIDNPDCTVDDLMQLIKGPDFPTGGIILGMARHARSLSHGPWAHSWCGQRPRSRQCARRPQPHRGDGDPLSGQQGEAGGDASPSWCMKSALEGISDIRDESDRNGMRIVIELKKDVHPQIILNYALQAHVACRRRSARTCWRWWTGEPEGAVPAGDGLSLLSGASEGRRDPPHAALTSTRRSPARTFWRVC